MKKRNLVFLLIIFTVLLITWKFNFFNLQSTINTSSFSGMTPKEASQIQPLSHDINLEAKIADHKVELNWTYKNKDGKISSFDVVRSEFKGGGWNDPITRVPLVEGQSKYKYVDIAGESNTKYFYQILGIRFSNGYETKEEASKSIEITYP